jgi:hypothetical protein
MGEISGYILTSSGRWINPLNPKPDEIYIEDLAHALSNICRFTGHVRCFYSVAEHSCRISDAASPENALWGLLHDAGEAYIGDIAKPVKYQRPGFGTYYRRAQNKLDEAVISKFGLSMPEPEEINYLDDMFVHTEQRDLMPEPIEPHPDSNYDLDTYSGPLHPERIEPWLPQQAEVEYLDRFYRLVETVEGKIEKSVG